MVKSKQSSTRFGNSKAVANNAAANGSWLGATPWFARPLASYVVIAAIFFSGAAGFAILQNTIAERGAGDDQALGATEVLQLTANLQGRFAVAERELGGRPANGPSGSPAEAMQMAIDLPSRFREVGQLLAAERRNTRSAAAPANGGRTSAENLARWYNLRPDEVTKLSANAQSQFADVNGILGVRSRAVDLQDPTPAGNSLPDFAPISLKTLSASEKRQILKSVLADTAKLFRQSLPIDDGPDTALFAVEASETTLRSLYRIRSSQNDANARQIRGKLQRRACARAQSNTTIHLGGQYEYILYDSQGSLVDQFTISKSSCF